MALRQGFGPFSNLSIDHGECQTPQSQNFSPDPKSLQATLEQIEAELRTEFEENDVPFQDLVEKPFFPRQVETKGFCFPSWQLFTFNRIKK